eukprot:210390-Pelagomonas_calceolata.AAC.15
MPSQARVRSLMHSYVILSQEVHVHDSASSRAVFLRLLPPILVPLSCDLLPLLLAADQTHPDLIGHYPYLEKLADGSQSCPGPLTQDAA